MCTECCLQVAVHDDLVHVTTADGATIRSRILVGADGNRSSTREYVHPGLQLTYAGAAVWRFFMTEPQHFVEPGESLVVNVGGKVRPTCLLDEEVCFLLTASFLMPEQQHLSLDMTLLIAPPRGAAVDQIAAHVRGQACSGRCDICGKRADIVLLILLGRCLAPRCAALHT